MNIEGWWWMMLVPIGLVFSAIASMRADQGGRNIVDFGDPFMGCFVPVVITLGSVIVALILVASHAVLRIGF